jgi:predicted HNH restriction endonuclease
MPEPTYSVDDYTDDELFMYDMQARMPDLTEEELTEALESAKANEVVFNKQINGLRNEYKKLEENRIQQDQLIAQQQQEEEYNKYANAVWEGISNQEDIAGTFELEEEDKQMLANFILGRDQAGISLLGKALNDP